MVQATTAAVGEIVLSGDFAGSDDANFPELRASGVTPGTYLIVERVTVDKKGRITSIGQASNADAILPAATKTSPGSVKASSTITSNQGKISAALASTNTLGIVKIGAGFIAGPNGQVDVDLTYVTANDEMMGYMRPGPGMQVLAGTIFIQPFTTNAGKSVPGLILVGDNLSVTDGIISAKDATTTTKGLVKISGSLRVADGTISVPDASRSTYGLMQIGDGFDASTPGLLKIQDATKTTRGIFRLGNYLEVDGGVVRVQYASKTKAGLISIGDGLVAPGGVLSAVLPHASAMGNGVVSPGGAFTIMPGGIISPAKATAESIGVVKFNGASPGVISYDAIMASSTTPGFLQIGSGFEDSPGYLSYKNVSATKTTPGTFKLASTGSLLFMADDLMKVSLDSPTTSTAGIARVGYGFKIVGGTLLPDIPLATNDQKGVAKIGDGMSVTNGIVSPVIGPATVSYHGLVKIGNRGTKPGLSLNAAGLLSLDMPFWSSNFRVDQNKKFGFKTATANTTGVVYPGTNLDISSGTLSLNLPVATATTVGTVKVDNSSGASDIYNVMKPGPDLPSGSPGMPVYDYTTTRTYTYSQSRASKDVYGMMRVGSGLTVDNGLVSVGQSVPTNAVLLDQANTYTQAQSTQIASQSYGTNVAETTEVVTIGGMTVMYVYPASALTSQVEVVIALDNPNSQALSLVLHLVFQQHADTTKTPTSLTSIRLASEPVLWAGGVVPTSTTVYGGYDIIEIVKTPLGNFAKIVKDIK